MLQKTNMRGKHYIKKNIHIKANMPKKKTQQQKDVIS